MLRNSLDAIADNNHSSQRGQLNANIKKNYLDRSIDMATTIDTGYQPGNRRRGAGGGVLSFQQKNMMQRFSS